MSVGEWVGVWTGVWVGGCVARIFKMPGRNNRIGAQIHIALYRGPWNLGGLNGPSCKYHRHGGGEGGGWAVYVESCITMT